MFELVLLSVFIVMNIRLFLYVAEVLFLLLAVRLVRKNKNNSSKKAYALMTKVENVSNWISKNTILIIVILTLYFM